MYTQNRSKDTNTLYCAFHVVSTCMYVPQDTVIAMQALAKFSEVTYSSQLNQSVTFDIDGLSAEPVTVTDENRFERTEVEV